MDRINQNELHELDAMDLEAVAGGNFIEDLVEKIKGITKPQHEPVLAPLPFP